MEAKIKHLEFAQTAINRMANNSFLLKGWSVTLTSALMVLSMKEVNKFYLFVSIVILIFFWMLDGYYLHREKLFRDIFDLVREKSDSEKINFNMSFDQLKDKGSVLDCALSPTILLFYGGILVAHLIILSTLICK